MIGLALVLGLQAASAQTLVSVELRGSLPTFLTNPVLRNFGLTARYDIDYYTVRYTMDNFEGGVDTVSGLMVRPSGSGLRYPVAVYQHGTTLTKFAVPSRSNPGFDLGYVIATQGYVSLSPDYLNMGDDPDGFHPYVHSRSEALAAISMRAALASSPAYADVVNDQLFLTGYSQGGHASMALHKILIQEYPNIPVTAAAHMSGPYSISRIMKDSVILKDVTFPYLAFLPYTVLGYQAVYPELDEEISELFQAPYVPIITAFRDGYANGLVPLDSLGEELIRLYIVNEGNANLYPSRLLRPEFAAELRNDFNSKYNRRLRENDTYNFVNPTPTRLLYCTADDQVNFLNSIVARDSLKANGATDTEAIDVRTTANHTQCVTPAVTAMINFFSTYQQILSGVDDNFSSDWSWRQSVEGVQVVTDDAGAQYRMILVDAAGRTVIDRAYSSGNWTSMAGVPPGLAVVRLIDEQGRVAAHSFIVR